MAAPATHKTLPKIIVNARFLTQQQTGVQRYAAEIARQLKQIDKNIVFVSPRNVVNKPVAKELGVISIGNFTSHLWEQVNLPLYLKKNGNPLLINLGNTAPLYYSNQLTTIHDTGFFVNKSWYSKGFHLYYRIAIPRIIKKSKRIITVSNFSASELIKHYKIHSDKIEVVKNGLPTVFSTKQIKTERLISEKYILSVGSLSPRKNIESVIESYLSLRNPNLKLVLVGNFNNSVFGKTSVIDLIKKSDNILLYESADDSTLASLYSYAECLVFLPFYEGFGLPALEALYFNCPVILSDIEVFKEFFASYAHFVSPLDLPQIEAAIKEVLQNKPTPNKKLPSVLKNEFSYSLSAHQLLGICYNLIV